MTTPVKNQNKLSGSNLTRRELIRSGLKGGSVVVVSLASPTVLACVKPSAYGSLSSHSGPNKPKEYTKGWGPQTWCRDEYTYKEAWKSTGCVRDGYYEGGQFIQPTRHYERFSNGYDKRLLRSMIEDSDFAKVCSAAYLNARSGKSDVLTSSEVHEIWLSVRNRGYFEPTAGLKWDEFKCTEYLRTTFSCA